MVHMASVSRTRGYRRLLTDLLELTRLVAHDHGQSGKMTLEEARALLERELGPTVAAGLASSHGPAAGGGANP